MKAFNTRAIRLRRYVTSVVTTPWLLATTSVFPDFDGDGRSSGTSIIRAFFSRLTVTGIFRISPPRTVFFPSPLLGSACH
jgi:hypothetical protein